MLTGVRPSVRIILFAREFSNLSPHSSLLMLFCCSHEDEARRVGDETSQMLHRFYVLLMLARLTAK